MSFSSGFCVVASTYILALTKSSSRVSYTVILKCPGLQYIKNCVRWNRFLLSAEFLSIVHFLYIFMNSFSVIFLLRSSSNSHTIRSTSVLPIRTLIRRRVSRTSSAVKNLWAWGADREWKTRSRYFSSVVLILNSYSFSSMVFSFSALRSRSFCMLNSNFPSLPRFSFSKTMLFLYLRCNAKGRSRRRMVFFYSFCIIILYPSQNSHSFKRKGLIWIGI